MYQPPFTRGNDGFAGIPAPWPFGTTSQQATPRESFSDQQSPLFTLLRANSQINAELSQLLSAALAQRIGQLEHYVANDNPPHIGHHSDFEFQTMHSQLISPHAMTYGSPRHFGYAVSTTPCQDPSSTVQTSNAIANGRAHTGLGQRSHNQGDLPQSRKRSSSTLVTDAPASSNSEHRASKQPRRRVMPLEATSAAGEPKRSLTSTIHSLLFRQYLMTRIFDLGLEIARPRKIYYKMMSDQQTARTIAARTKDISLQSQTKDFTPNVVKSHLQRFRPNIVDSRMEVLGAIYEGLQEGEVNDVQRNHFEGSMQIKDIMRFNDQSDEDDTRVASANESVHLETNTRKHRPGALRFRWTDELHICFTASVFELGLEATKPAELYKRMIADPRFATIMKNNGQDAAYVKNYFYKFRDTIYSRDLFVTEMTDSIRQARLKKKELGTQSKALNPEYHIYPFHVASTSSKLAKNTKISDVLTIERTGASTVTRASRKLEEEYEVHTISDDSHDDQSCAGDSVGSSDSDATQEIATIR